MAWDSEAFRLQSQLRSLLLEDSDACIQAIAGLRQDEVARLALLVQLGQEFQDQPSSSGIVDAGLDPFPGSQSGLREINSLDVSDQGATGFGPPPLPAGAPEPRFPSVPTPGVAGDSGDRSGSQAAQSLSGRQGSQDNTNNGPPNPWEGWHPGLLGQPEPDSSRSGRLGPEGRRRSALHSQGLQPGTVDFGASGLDRQEPTGRHTGATRTEDIRNLMPPGLDALEPGAFQFLDFFQGAPHALYSKVGHHAGLPPVHGLSALHPLRPHRERSLPLSLRRRNFTIGGYCLLSCQAHCGWACSRPVSTEARQLHDHHFCQVCHR